MHDFSGNVTVGQYLLSVSMLLSELSYCCSLSEEFLNTVDALSDFSYGWAIVDQFVYLHFLQFVKNIEKKHFRLFAL